MIIVNLIDKKRLIADGSAGLSFSAHGDGGVAWKARLLLFMGFALMAGGLAGSIVSLLYPFVSYPSAGRLAPPGLIDRPNPQIRNSRLGHVRRDLLGGRERASKLGSNGLVGLPLFD